MRNFLCAVYCLYTVLTCVGMETYLLPEPEKYGIDVCKTKISDLKKGIVLGDPIYTESEGFKHWQLSTANFEGASLGTPSTVSVRSDASGHIVTFICSYCVSVVPMVKAFLLKSTKYVKSNMFDEWSDIEDPESCFPQVVYCYGNNLFFGLQVNHEEKSCALIWGQRF